MTDTEPIIIVGLGNPGPRYAPTRHNIGFMAVDALAARERATFSLHKKSGAQTATVRLAGRAVTLAKPTTYMNESGRNVGPLLKFFKAAPSNLVVLHDELDIDFGVVRLKLGGGEGGHNGLRSLTNALGTRDYLRVRLGVGRPPGRQDPADFVLKPFSSTERPEVGLIVENGIDATELLLTQGLEAAQNQVHSW